MADGRGRLNVVITREESLSPRSRSGSASPSRNIPPAVGEKIPQQMNYQDVVLLHRKWREAKRNADALQKEVAVLHGRLNKAGREATALSGNSCTATAQTKLTCQELQERLTVVKRLLDKSRLESVKMSRLVVAKSRELNEARKEAARVPELTATVDRLLSANRAAEKAHGQEGRRAEEEQRRSKAWRAQVDKVALQSVQSAERRRVLSSENGELRAELEHVRARLKEAERRIAVAGTVSEELRLKRIEAGLMAEELGAVRQDCGRLVQLISSTKEYAQFRRLWDDSGSLTRLNNARATSSYCFASRSGGGSSGGGGGSSGGAAAVVGKAGVAAAFAAEGTPQPQGGTAVANAASTTNYWEQALRSEWASPSKTIIDVVTTSSMPVGAAELATVVAQSVDDKHDGKGEEGEAEITGLGGARARRRAGTETEAGAPPSPRRVSFLQHGRKDPSSSQVAVAAVDKAVEVSKGSGETEKRERGNTVPSTLTEATAIGGGGGGGDLTEAEAVRWGRMDLLSVLYPPPVAGEGSDTHIDVGAEVSMWVPQEAARLCRRYVRDFDGYSGVPLDVEQHRLLRSLLVGLNASWRQSERKHVERLTRRFRAELKAVHRRLDMRKPMEAVLAQRAAERRQSSPALLCSTTAGASAAKTGGSNARPPRWGADGKRITGREINQGGWCGGACTECRHSCSACGRKKENTRAVGGRVMRVSNGRGGKRAGAGRRQRPKASSAAPAPSDDSEIAGFTGPVAAVATKPGGQGTTNECMSNHALLSGFLDGHDRGHREKKSDGTRMNNERRRRPSARRHKSRAGEAQRVVCFACGMASSVLPPEEKSGESGRDEEARCDLLGQQAGSESFITGRALSTAPAAYHARGHQGGRTQSANVPPLPPTASQGANWCMEESGRHSLAVL